MFSGSKHLHRILLVGYVAVFSLFVLIYFLSATIPAEYLVWKTLIQDLFLNLAIALTIAFGSYFLLRPLLGDRDRKTLEDFQKATLELLTLEKGVREAGVVRIYENMTDDLLRDRLAVAQQRVYILSIWLDHVKEKTDSIFEQLAQKGLSLKILQAHPESEICKMRAYSQKALFPTESSFDPDFIADIINKSNAYFSKLQAKTAANLEVRLFDTMPPFSLVLIDSTAFVSFYGCVSKIGTTPLIEFRFSKEDKTFSYFEEFILNQFETIWDKSVKAL